MTKLTDRIVADLSAENAMEHIRWLTENTPNRMSGKGDDVKAATYITSKLAEYGCETKLLEFDAYNSWPEYSDLKVISPETLTIDSIPCCHIASTLPEGIKTELIYVGAGGLDDYQGRDVRGKVVLVEVSYAPATPEKARIAADKGAVGIICMNWGGDEPVICRRALKAVWGNPTPETFDNIPQLAGLSVTRKAGEHLAELCSRHERVEIVITVKATRHWDKLVQPIGILKGSEKPEEFLIVSSHLDAWEPGVTCNATGDAATLEIARVLGKYKDKLKRSVYFTYWNGHEIAEAAGSTWFADNYWDAIRDHCVGYINVDSPGMKGAVKFMANASRELSDFAADIIKNLVNGDPRVNYLTKTGDQSFFGAGVPSIAGWVSFDDEYVEKTHGATLGWWNHTVEDTIDKVDPKNLQIDLTVDSAFIARLVTDEVLPYDFSKTCDDIRSKLEMINKQSNGMIELGSLIQNVKKLEQSIVSLNELCQTAMESNCRETAKLVNKTLLKLSRTLTNAFYTYADKYGQDSYGRSILSKPIPLLYPAVELSKTDRNSQEFKLMMTQLVRNRNRVSDAICEAMDAVENCLMLAK